MAIRRILFAALAALTVVSAAGALEKSDVLRREFHVPTGGARAVLIDNVFGSVTVRGSGRGDTVSVEIRRHVDARRESALAEAFDEVTLGVDEAGDGLALYQDGPFRCGERWGGRDRHRGGCGWHADYDLEWSWTVSVPADVRLEVRTVNGGDVVVDGVEGDVRAANVNGELRLAGLVGAVTASTVNGEIAAEFAAAPRADASFETVNGEIELRLPRGSGADIGLKTMNGELWSDFELTALPQRARPVSDRRGRGNQYRLEHDTELRLGAGGPRLDCQTLNGDIVVRER